MANDRLANCDAVIQKEQDRQRRPEERHRSQAAPTEHHELERCSDRDGDGQQNDQRGPPRAANAKDRETGVRYALDDDERSARQRIA